MNLIWIITLILRGLKIYTYHLALTRSAIHVRMKVCIKCSRLTKNKRECHKYRLQKSVDMLVFGKEISTKH